MQTYGKGKKEQQSYREIEEKPKVIYNSKYWERQGPSKSQDAGSSKVHDEIHDKDADEKRWEERKCKK